MVSQSLIDQVQADLAKLLGVPRDAVQLCAWSSTVWNDTSLGCPQPDQAYLQVLTPGYRIFLQCGDMTYEYHTDSDEHFVFCGELTPFDDRPPASAFIGLEVETARQYVQALGYSFHIVSEDGELRPITLESYWAGFDVEVMHGIVTNASWKEPYFFCATPWMIDIDLDFGFEALNPTDASVLDIETE